MAPALDLSLADRETLKAVIAAVEDAQDAIGRARDALRDERRRAAASPDVPPGPPPLTEQGRVPPAVEATVRPGPSQAEVEVIQLRQQVQALKQQLDQETRKREQDLAGLRDRVAASIGRGLSETFRLLGAEDPWLASARLRAQMDESQRTIADLRSQVGGLRADRDRSREELKRAEGSREALRSECDRLRARCDTLPQQVEAQVFETLLNRLGLSHMAPFLIESGVDESASGQATVQLVTRLADYLQDEGVFVIDAPGQIVRLADETALVRYAIPEDEYFRPGTVRVSQHGVRHRDQVIIKARVRYVEEQASEPQRTERPISAPAAGESDAFAGSGEPRAGEPEDLSSSE